MTLSYLLVHPAQVRVLPAQPQLCTQSTAPVPSVPSVASITSLATTPVICQLHQSWTPLTTHQPSKINGRHSCGQFRPIQSYASANNRLYLPVTVHQGINSIKASNHIVHLSHSSLS